MTEGQTGSHKSLCFRAKQSCSGIQIFSRGFTTNIKSETKNSTLLNENPCSLLVYEGFPSEAQWEPFRSNCHRLSASTPPAQQALHPNWHLGCHRYANEP